MSLEITAEQALEMIEKENAVLIDIRDANSFEQIHIEGAKRIDNDNFQAFIDAADRSKAIIVCCYHGISSQPAAQSIISMGFKSFSLQGGMAGWHYESVTSKDDC